ncbi:MAG: hexulose-6-phosphate synthase [Magnetococcales bacterium]|nr:hexulose-6-phosphate synthase [Magnetococcales bacterium]
MAQKPKLNNKQKRILQAIFDLQTNIHWNDIESLLQACGADLKEGRGSRIRVKIFGAHAVFHRPHGKGDGGTDKGRVADVKNLLINVDIKPS